MTGLISTQPAVCSYGSLPHGSMSWRGAGVHYLGILPTPTPDPMHPPPLLVVSRYHIIFQLSKRDEVLGMFFCALCSFTTPASDVDSLSPLGITVWWSVFAWGNLPGGSWGLLVAPHPLHVHGMSRDRSHLAQGVSGGVPQLLHCYSDLEAA